jgi:hypothetical protein
MTQKIQDLVTNYLPLLIEGKCEQLLDLFAGEPLLNDQRQGEVKGIDEFEQFVKASHEWLKQRQARVESLAITQSSTRIVEEFILHLKQDKKAISLPIAIVGDLTADRLIFLRSYHSMWSFLEKHAVRSPIFSNLPQLEMPDVIGRYQEALAKGDLETIIQQFEPNGTAREPSGGEFIYKGTEELRRFYGMLFANGGGIPLEHCSVTDDGVRCAVEYNVTYWGRTKLPSQAGVAVYERGSSGLLEAARIYDDVDPPITGE